VQHRVQHRVFTLGTPSCLGSSTLHTFVVVQASIAANTYVVSGHAESKKLQDLLPGIINQLGPDNLANLKKLAETYQGGGGPPPPGAGGDDDDDEDVPDLVDNFEEASK